MTPEERPHGQPCVMCGRPIDSLAGDARLWPVLLPLKDGTGISRPHHRGCVVDALADRADAIRRAAEDMRERCARVAKTHFQGYESVDFLGGGGDAIAEAIRALPADPLTPPPADVTKEG